MREIRAWLPEVMWADSFRSLLGVRLSSKDGSDYGILKIG